MEGKAKVGKVEQPLDSKNGQAIHMNSPPYAPVCLQALLGISENMHNARICAAKASNSELAGHWWTLGIALAGTVEQNLVPGAGKLKARSDQKRVGSWVKVRVRLKKLGAPRSNDVPAKPRFPQQENATLESEELGEPETKARSKSKFTSDCIKIGMPM